MSLKTLFCLWFFQGTKSSLTNFYCFNIHAFISLRKRGIPGHNKVLCVVTKLQLSCVPKKSLLNIETIKFF